MNPNNQQFNPNQYDFITNPASSPKKPVFGGSTKSRVILAVGGLFIVLLMFWIVSTILSSGSRQATTNLKTVVAEQAEIVRVSGLGMQSALGSEAKGYTTTVNYIISSSQNDLTTELSAQGIKLTKVELAAKTNTKTDDILTSASSNNQYDQTIIKTLNDLLEKHKKTVKTAYDTTSRQNTKDLLEKLYDDCDILLKAKSPGR